MNADILFDALEQIDPGMIEAADRPVRRKNLWIGWIAAAACLCAAVGLLAHLPRAETAPDREQQWSETMRAADYFKNNPQQSGSNAPPPEACIVMPPYAAAVSLDGERAALEAEQVLPIMPEHPEQDFQAQYNGDGSLYKVVFRWMRRDAGHSLENYSDLSLTAAPKEISELSDEVSVYDVGMPVTVTLRDGIRITAEGGENVPKTLTWRTEDGWYQIGGSWNDSFEDMVALLDWFWAHPLALERFLPPPEETICEADPADYPDPFPGAIPNFAALGYKTESERLTVSQGRPVWFEGVYTRGDTRIVWTVDTASTPEARASAVGRPRAFMQGILEEALKERDQVTLFIDGTDRPCDATLRLESGTADDASELIQDLAE